MFHTLPVLVVFATAVGMFVALWAKATDRVEWWQAGLIFLFVAAAITGAVTEKVSPTREDIDASEAVARAEEAAKELKKAAGEIHSKEDIVAIGVAGYTSSYGPEPTLVGVAFGVLAYVGFAMLVDRQSKS